MGLWRMRLELCHRPSVHRIRMPLVGGVFILRLPWCRCSVSKRRLSWKLVLLIVIVSVIEHGISVSHLFPFCPILENATWRVVRFLTRTRCPRTSILKNGMVVEKLPKSHLPPLRRSACPSFSMSLSFPLACITGQEPNFNPREIDDTRIVFKNDNTMQYNTVV